MNTWGRYYPHWTEEGGVEEDLPIGSIALWSLLNGAIPDGWAECDGVQNAPGPDLRDRFVVARGSGHTIDTTGGSATAILNHVHPVNVSDPWHAHLQQRYPTTTGVLSGFTADVSMSGTQTDLTLTTKSAATGITATSSNPAGGSASVEPPFYVLIYIQRMT